MCPRELLWARPSEADGPGRKTLEPILLTELCQQVLGEGYVPVILDWRRGGPPPDEHGARYLGRGHWVWGGREFADGREIAALASRAALAIGVDSGPAKIAAGTATPTVALWTGFHPIQLHHLPVRNPGPDRPDHRRVPRLSRFQGVGG